MVKASELIEEIENADYEAVVTDAGDTAPYLQSVEIETDDNHICSVKGCLAYIEDDAKYGVDSGESEVVIMGITFSNDYLYAENVTIKGDIEYDQDLKESDVIAAAEEYISWPCADGLDDCSDFDEDSVFPDDILELLGYCEHEFFVFALDADENVCAFYKEDLNLDFDLESYFFEEDMEKEEKEKLILKLKEMSYAYITQTEAYERLAQKDISIDY